MYVTQVEAGRFITGSPEDSNENLSDGGDFTPTDYNNVRMEANKTGFTEW